MLALLLAALSSAPVTIRVDIRRPVQTIRPLRAMGSSVDSDPEGKIPLLYSPERIRLMRSTGLGTLTYRLYTELSIQDWHWNPRGGFSAGRQGYWTSSASPGPHISDSFGYTLPDRGSSRDQGADNNYSRIDDGDSRTYWKSNPYLTHAFTHEPDSFNPQWVVVQFLRPQAIDTARIRWSNPYATRFQVEYWVGNADAVVEQGSGSWRAFTGGRIAHGRGGTSSLRLARKPVVTTAIRLVMSASSNTCDSHGPSDMRNCVGFAVQDIGVGRTIGGQFRDLVVRAKNGSCSGALYCTPDAHRQTLMWTSSTDPWHSSTDRIRDGQDQPGLDIVSRSGITGGLPAIYPVPLFYSTPQNAANEIRYLERNGYPIAYIEMGEEVDGQYALPEDYAALYVQFAAAIHRVDPRIRLGGPVFEGVPRDVPAWANATGDRSWLHRFIGYLQRRGKLSDFQFMSWEHYPYHNCDSGKQLQADLLDEPSFVRRIVAQWRADGVPPTVPLLETEDNFSPDGTGAPQRLYGALWLADFMGASFASGVSYATYYQSEPEPLDRARTCKGWGAYNPYIVGGNFNVAARGAAYYALRLLTGQWALPGDAPHGVYPVQTSLGDHNALVTAYALHRPDGAWSVLIVNKDTAPRTVSIRFGASGAVFTGKVTRATFGAAQYRWDGNPEHRPNPNGKPLIEPGLTARSTYRIAPLSVTVLRGAISP